MTARRSLLALVALLVNCLGCLNEPPAELGVWSEFLAPAEVRTHIPTLSQFDAELHLAVRPQDLNDELWALLREAAAAGVGVRPWLQLPEHGVWLNEQNISEFGEFARRFLLRAADNDIAVDWLIFDLEPGLAYAEALRSVAASGDFEALLQLLGTHRDVEGFEVASLGLRELVDELHARDVRVMVATLPWTIDDLGDSDADLQDVFDTPLADVPWDQVCVMVYRPVFAELFGVPLSPGYVASYARSAQMVFGADTQVAIGNISTPGLLVPPGYTDPVAMRLDVSAALSAGLDSVSVFSLDGMVVAGGPERWLAAVWAPTPRLCYPDPITAVVRSMLNWLDRAADEP
jgi:hypothetical protein